MMIIRIKLFGPEARAAGTREAELHLDSASATVAHLRAALVQKYPALAQSHIRLAINHAFASDDQLVSEHDEIALIGPVSGG